VGGSAVDFLARLGPSDGTFFTVAEGFEGEDGLERGSISWCVCGSVAGRAIPPPFEDFFLVVWESMKAVISFEGA
jgi:hypothetical protein